MKNNEWTRQKQIDKYKNKNFFNIVHENTHLVNKSIV